MATKRLQQPQRSSKETFLVICEGETERNYVDFLRNSYHSPIRIVSRVAGQQVTQQLINKHVEQLKLGKYDKITSFLMYDMDVEEVNRRFPLFHKKTPRNKVSFCVNNFSWNERKKCKVHKIGKIVSAFFKKKQYLCIGI